MRAGIIGLVAGALALGAIGWAAGYEAGYEHGRESERASARSAAWRVELAEMQAGAQALERGAPDLSAEHYRTAEAVRMVREAFYPGGER